VNASAVKPTATKWPIHYGFTIGDRTFTYTRLEHNIAAEAVLDGIYVIRTSVGADTLDTPSVVEAAKNLSAVEANFRSIKAIDLHLRTHPPPRTRVRTHVLICMLAAHLIWHLPPQPHPTTAFDLLKKPIPLTLT